MKLPIMLAAALAAPPAFAGDETFATRSFQARAGMLEMRCEAESRLARAIMEARQRSIPRADVLSGSATPGHHAIADAAYDAPHVPTQDQGRVIFEFGEKSEIACYRRKVGR